MVAASSAASASSSYFQGGDYVELLSAQGKAPASTWKLQGKILKSFDKAIKGNAFHMDGSSETKMQLPKTPTPSSSSLGLTQRFLVFQLCVAHTRSFSIEIGFSDFQKIRRRLVFASAFRETTMTALHVQIPLSSSSISRDQWMNFVFDLQALTEYYFPGSSYRSMESICISGSCRLKRIFTMKDAPLCPAVEQELQAQMIAYKQQRLHGKDASAVPTVVAGFAEMKDIPKQFVFSVGPSSLPIPTEYFLTGTATEREPAGAAPLALGIANKSGGGKAGKVAVAAKPGPAKPAPTAEVLGANRNRAQTAGRVPVTTGGSSRSGEPRARSAASVRAKETRQEEPSKTRDALSARGTESPPRSSRHPHHTSPAQVSSAVTRSMNRARESNHGIRSVDVERSPHVGGYYDSDSDEEAEEAENGEEEEEEKEEQREEEGEDEEEESEIKSVANSRGRPSPMLSPVHVQHTESLGDHRRSHDALRMSAALERKTHRQTVIAEIQSKLDQLTREADEEEERDRKRFVERVSLGSSPPSNRAGIFTFATDNRAGASSVSTTGKAQAAQQWPESELLRSPEPMVLKRMHATKKPEILFSSSIFSFDRDAPQSNLAASNDSSGSSSPHNKKKLFDWDSLLEDSVASVSKSPIAFSASSRHGEPRDKVAMKPKVKDDDSGPPSSVSDAQMPSTLSRKHNHQATNASGSRGTTKSNADRDSLAKSSTRPKTPEAAVQNRSVRGDSLSLMRRSRDRHDEIASSTEFIGLEQAQPSPRSEADDSDGDLSIDLTENLDELDPVDAEAQAADVPETDVVATSSPKSATSDDEDSFNFDELVVRDRDYQPPPQKNEISPKRATSRPAATSTVAPAVNSSQKTLLKSEKHDSTPPPKSNDRAKNTVAVHASASRVGPEVATKTHSPLRKKTPQDPQAKPEEPAPPVSRVMSSSHRRLASLLESTDWSQLPLSSSTVVSKSAPTQAPTTRTTTTTATEDGRRDKQRTGAATAAATSSSSSSLELVYDPILRCYYDPVGKKYYTLAK